MNEMTDWLGYKAYITGWTETVSSHTSKGKGKFLVSRKNLKYKKHSHNDNNICAVPKSRTFSLIAL